MTTRKAAGPVSAATDHEAREADLSTAYGPKATLPKKFKQVYRAPPLRIFLRGNFLSEAEVIDRYGRDLKALKRIGKRRRKPFPAPFLIAENLHAPERRFWRRLHLVAWEVILLFAVSVWGAMSWI